ncbi:MAG: tetratricopeptide repeat protein [Alphaproteobacteria bacterium]|nr:tetratricopeptide repeat protein [Alphaproteobacteria bacterium]
MSDIFREIDEELRKENLAKLWTRHGRWVIVAAVLVVVATAVGVGWRQYRDQRSAADGVRFAAALDLVRDGKNKDAADAFAAIAAHAAAGHAMLARFEEAALKARAGDAAGALTIYDQLAADTSADPVYRAAATLLAADVALDKGDTAGAIQRLKPLTDGASPWHPFAVELTGFAQLKAGDSAGARKSFQQLADDPNAPPSARQRAAQMIAALNP